MYNVIFDEMPELLDIYSFDLSLIPSALDAVVQEWRRAVSPWAHSLIAKAPDDEARERAWEAEEFPGTHLRMPCWDGDPDFDVERIRKVFAPIAVAVALRRSADPSAKISFTGDKVDVVRLSDCGSYLKNYGGTILGAGLPIMVLRVLRPDIEYQRIDVEDPPGVEITRIRVLMSDSTTKKLKADPKRVERICDDILRRKLMAETLIVCPKGLEEQVKAYVGDLAHVAHYGAIRGLDDWMHCDVFATIGDHYDNLGAVDIEASYFGVDARLLSQQKLSTELEQAHGRARDCRRTEPALHLHYGMAWPGRWYRSNSREERWTDIVNGL